MENISKALLIAAAVLVVILIITIGLKIFGSTTNTQKTAIDTGKSISEKTSEATDLALSQIKDNSIGTLITKDNYGDYIDLGKSVVGDNNSTTDDWRILYNDKNGHVYIILADYLPNVNPAVEASGLHAVDGKEYNVNSTSREDLLNSLNHKTAWNSLIPNTLVNKGVKVKGAISKELLEESYKNRYGINEVSRFSIDNDNSKGIDSLYMCHYNSHKSCYGYLLNTPTPDNNNSVYYMHCTGYIYTYAHFYETSHGLCPIVILPSNIKITKKIVNEKTIWSLLQ